MPVYRLEPHPDHPPLCVEGIEVEVRNRTGEILLGYRVLGADRLVTPEALGPDRSDGLWRTTCFELFLMLDDDERYVEFNFSASTRWAAYAFDGYREGMVPLARDVAPSVERRSDGVAVACDLGGLPPGELRMALSAVIEEEGGVKSYWAFAHPPGAPDFHHPACFVARLPAPDGP